MFGNLEQTVIQSVDTAALILELLAVVIIVSAVLVGMWRYVRDSISTRVLIDRRFD